MKKLSILCVAALGAALVAVVGAPTASAYPDRSCTLTVDNQVVASGEHFTATGETTVEAGTTNGEVDWTFTFDGVTKKRKGATASARFRAPEVTTSREIPLTGRVVTPDGTCERTIVITVGSSMAAGPQAPGGDGDGDGVGRDSTDDGDGGLLPNTGGPGFWLLVAGVLLLLGGGAVLVTRRRTEQAGGNPA
ncbi:MAG TPA: LPXTG cell wall anchor domain-containing protein [Marmoricola sp.]